MLSSYGFFHRVKRLALKMQQVAGTAHFMHDERKRRRQHRDYRPFLPLTIAYRGRSIAVEVLCDPKGEGFLPRFAS